VIRGFGTPRGTARFAGRFTTAQECGFYRQFDALHISTLGLGTYLGNPDDQTDIAYREAVVTALRGGINFLDTAINYRHQRSERSIGAALRQLSREEMVVCTKGGFLTPGAVPDGLAPDDVVG
jgi:aryl-alcohol dehydrogenase-like predicted oxidoreductase